MPCSILQAAGDFLPADRTTVVILAYSTIGAQEGFLPLDQFATHLNELRAGRYTVLSLPDAITALKESTSLPPRSVVITFQGIDRAFIQDVAPLLRTHNLPFTVFYTAGDLPWEDLQRLGQEKGVTLGLLPPVSLVNLPRAEILAQINTAIVAHREHFKKEPVFFAYPMGEYSSFIKVLIKEQGFDAAFTLESAAAHARSDIMALPRFIMMQGYGDLDRFVLVANALPFPVTDITPTDPVSDTTMPVLGFTVGQGLSLKGLACFVTGQPRPHIEIVGVRRVEIRLAHPLHKDPAWLNCTLPAPPLFWRGENISRWRWFSRMLLYK